MHIRNHSRPSMVLLSLVTLFSTQVFALEFAELSACRLHYQTVVQPGATDVAAMDTWCLETAKMDPLNVCADKRLYSFMATNSINSDQKSQYRESYRQACYREQSPQVAANTTPSTTTSTSVPAGAVIGATAGVTYAEPTATGAPKQPILTLQTCTDVNRNACEAANQSATAQFAAAQATYNTNLATYNAQVKSATDLTSQQRQQVQQATQNMVVQAGMQALGSFGSGSGGTQAGRAGLQIGGPTNSTTTSIAPAQPTPVVPASGNNTSAAVTPTNPQVAATAEQPLPPGQDRQLQSELNQACQPGNAPVPFDSSLAGLCGDQPNIDQAAASPAEGQLTQAGDTAAQNLQTAVTNADAQSRTLSAGGASMPFTAFMGIYTPLSTQHYGQEFRTQKEACVKKAQRANKFCLEGSSPGAKFAKGLMDYSGPVLALVRSANKACSTTAKVTNIAQTAMTLAKGVCVAMKISCDTGCAQTRTTVETINTQLTSLRGAANSDYATALAACTSPLGVQNPACVTEVNQKKAIAENIITTLTERFRTEVGIDSGSTGAMIASCHDKTKDILLMGTNILTLLAARGSAEKCEKETAASGGGTSSGTTTAEYCSVAANSATQFCKCQATPNAEGCAGIGTNTPDALASSNQIGANLQTGSGLSSFAGGNAGGSAGGGSDFGIGSENGATNGITADLNSKSATGTGPAAATGAGVGGGGGGGGGAADPAATAAGLKEDKKGVLGTLSNFASSLGGMFGGGSKGGSTGNGSLSSQQQAAIQRKIASDKISGEVTGSSGLDNFSKIKKSYGQKADTLMQAP